MEIGELLNLLGIIKKPLGGVFATAIFVFYAVTSIATTTDITWRIIAPLCVAFAILLLYLFYLYKINRLPSAAKGKTGILFVVNAENEKSYKDFEHKMISLFKDTLTQTTKHPFQPLCIRMPQNFQRKDVDTCVKLLTKTESVIIIFADYLTDSVDGPSEYQITLNTGIIHPTYSASLTKQFELELSRIVAPIQKNRFSTANKLEIFTCTAVSLVHVCQYIAGVAALFAGNVQEALFLWTDEYNALRTNPQTDSPLKDIFVALPVYLAHCHLLLAHKAYSDFWNNHDLAKLDDANKELELANQYSPDTFIYHTLKAAIIVLTDRSYISLQKAHQHVSKCRDLNQGKNWKYSEAFLLTYTSTNPLKIYRAYRKAFNSNAEENEIELIEYIEYILNSEPQKYMLHFALALLYQHIGNFKQAKFHATQYCTIRPKEQDGAEMTQILNTLLSFSCFSSDTTDIQNCLDCLMCKQ